LSGEILCSILVMFAVYSIFCALSPWGIGGNGECVWILWVLGTKVLRSFIVIRKVVVERSGASPASKAGYKHDSEKGNNVRTSST
jgi:hypothetical protein